MNGSIVTVFWAWSAKMSWKIWEGVSGLRCCHFSLASVDKKSVKANLIVADQPNLWGLVILVVCDHYIVCADLKQIALCDFHISTTKKSSALFDFQETEQTYLGSTTPAAGITDTLGTAADTDENISPVENPIFAILTKIHL